MIYWTPEEFFIYMVFLIIPANVLLTLLFVTVKTESYVNNEMDKLVEGNPAKALAEVTRRNAGRAKNFSLSKEVILRCCMFFGLRHKDWVVYGILANHCLENPYRQEQIEKLNRSSFHPKWLQKLEFRKPTTQDGK